MYHENYLLADDEVEFPKNHDRYNKKVASAHTTSLIVALRPGRESHKNVRYILPCYGRVISPPFMKKFPTAISSLTLSRQVSSADNLCKQFGTRSGPTISESKMFNTLMVFLKVFFSKNLILKIISRREKLVKNYPACKALKVDKIALIDYEDIRSLALNHAFTKVSFRSWEKNFPVTLFDLRRTFNHIEIYNQY